MQAGVVAHSNMLIMDIYIAMHTGVIAVELSIIGLIKAAFLLCRCEALRAVTRPQYTLLPRIHA